MSTASRLHELESLIVKLMREVDASLLESQTTRLFKTYSSTIFFYSTWKNFFTITEDKNAIKRLYF
ncbi:hypothetical protein [Bartonella doshiae]|uniref:Uncharacterized protein n=2 Tax=Bartonella doshiae TaxID=33044 RepID=A0A380ZDM9_BARDO|nr:hypothetical protein [Bartonella doshiae]EJF80912.1 hypothetical protein MCS_00625 [Bartonella doshiae NCTC 12862 = ATCC 700133]MBB6159458.1 hypothetical protein [Bartonella doshiae]SUV45048.1 Uncharacterised protein [Bartonella doshiae]